VLPAGATVWHIAIDGAVATRSACGVALSMTGTARRENGLDRNVFSLKGKRVCVRCRRRLV
jgi:hypothetical protein